MGLSFGEVSSRLYKNRQMNDRYSSVTLPANTSTDPEKYSDKDDKDNQAERMGSIQKSTRLGSEPWKRLLKQMSARSKGDISV